MPTESIIVTVFVVCAFLSFMTVLAFAQRVAGGGPNRVATQNRDASS
jgi:hypothetical protein